ncbi:hypothetical protein PtA15_1A388 [Puccinia triticina]|uniref:Hydrophobin n=1 Tax=Puccinia triticina TaxID=208348 RepID=A0ABY7CAZ0_9BASI|nr:uncharacterized protein PtA15_1A388 [Puccinia triticina]WAQ81050.1 hypothetical protein PtA15_1A388 [Puccinia triticina]
MNFNASAIVALALSMGAFLAIASPLPHWAPAEHECNGLLNCNNVKVLSGQGQLGVVAPLTAGVLPIIGVGA